MDLFGWRLPFALLVRNCLDVAVQSCAASFGVRLTVVMAFAANSAFERPLQVFWVGDLVLGCFLDLFGWRLPVALLVRNCLDVAVQSCAASFGVRLTVVIGKPALRNNFGVRAIQQHRSRAFW